MSITDFVGDRIKDVVSMAIAIQLSLFAQILPDGSGAPIWLILLAVVITLRVIQKEVGRRLTSFANR